MACPASLNLLCITAILKSILMTSAIELQWSSMCVRERERAVYNLSSKCLRIVMKILVELVCNAVLVKFVAINVDFSIN